MQREHGTAILFVTHDLGVVAKISQRVSVLYAGKVVEEADTAVMFAAPRHAYTRALMAATPRYTDPLASLKPVDKACLPDWRPRSPPLTATGGRRMAEPLLSVRGLEVAMPDMARKTLFGRAPKVTILKGLDFDLPRNSVTGIVGESGSGKSTLGRALVRLIEPSAGRVVFDGRDITHLPEAALKPLRRDLQMIFQDPMSSLNPRRTIAAIIAAPLKQNGMGDNLRDRVAEMLQRVGTSRKASASATGTSFPAASASASALRGRWRCRRNSCSPTRSCRASTCRPRRRS